MKNPFAEQNSNGIIVSIVGIILLVFTALVLTLALEKKITLPSFSSDSLVSENDALRRQINHLEIQLAVQERKQKVAEKNRQDAERVKELIRQTEAALEEMDVIRRLIKDDKAAIVLIKEGKETHRLRYRDHIRALAVGKTYDSITTPLGKTYSDVRIKEVTPLGVTISHSHGVCRLGFQKMPREWRKTLMFTAVEVARATAAEQQRQTAMKNRIDQREKKIGKVRQSLAKQRKISSLRRQIAALRIKYSTASLEASLARNKVSYQRSLRLARRYARSSYRYYDTTTGRYYRSRYRPRYRVTFNGSKSVPGSLETWEQRAVRYERAKAKYAAQLINLRSRLSVIDPD